MTIHWIKPSGVEIETNDSDETIAYCESLGWKPMTTRQADPAPEVTPEVTQDSPTAPVED